MKRSILVLLALVLIISGALSACAKKQEEVGGELEIFSWWTSGGEVEALNAVYDIFKAAYPEVTINNAALAGGQGQGGNMKALLETRMLGGEPPDSFQVHLGRELTDSHVIADRMEPLGWLYEEEGWYDVMPADVVAIASYDGEPYSVPVNIHRSNCLWYRPSRLAEAGVTAPPNTWDEFFEIADKLKEKGIPAIAIAEQDANGGFSGHMFENIMLSVMGADKYRGLFDGSTPWSDPAVTESLEIMNRIYDYANPDYLSTAWGDINDRFVSDDGPAMMLMGDWTHGVLMSKGFDDYEFIAAPGTHQYFMLLSDSFGLPKGAPHRANAIAFLRIIGSREGQDAFNPIKGSIPARTDGDRTRYDEYLNNTMDDWANLEGTPSIQHGAATSQAFLVDYDIALADLATNRDVAKAQELLVAAAETAAFGQ
ncbi:MAG: ABC transporter substrate-binding protein [Anaerolineae bacterium]|jgi:glucose/mannose transport system substrate-binding protein|nr:carbohydrate ABC transporter substrate-binding protein [Chloroflexota bacterium]